jgi:hypothetical protein
MKLKNPKKCLMCGKKFSTDNLPDCLIPLGEDEINNQPDQCMTKISNVN